VFNVITDCDLMLAVNPEFERPMVAPLTPCCGASGKGSATSTGVCCRKCYREVPAMYGDCFMLGDPGETLTLEGWIIEATRGACPVSLACATTTLADITGRLASRERHPAGKGRVQA
jgi:hypothetical protein